MAALTSEQAETLNALLTTIGEKLPGILEKLNQTTTAIGSSADSASVIAQKLLEGQNAASTAAEAADASLGVYQSIATNAEVYAEQIKAIASALQLITTELKAQRQAIPAGVDAEITKLERSLKLRQANLEAMKDTTRAMGQTETAARRMRNLEGEQAGAPGLAFTPFVGASFAGAPKTKPKPKKDKQRPRKKKEGEGRGSSGGILGGASVAILSGVTGLAREGAQTLAAYYDELESVYKATSKVSTGLVRYTGLVMNADAMVRRGIPGQKTFAQVLIEQQERLAPLGVTMESLSEGYTKVLGSSFAFRTEMTKGTKESRINMDNLSTYAIAFEKMGLGIEEYGKTLDVLSKTYGRTNIVKDTRDFGAELMHISRTTGQIPTQVAKDFTTFMAGIGSAYSFDKAKKIFKELSLTSAETGVAMDTLVKGVAKFDELDTAAESVGELNAMLGGPYLNTLDMVNATESERIEMLRSAAKESGVSFDALKKFGRLSVGEAMGFDPQASMRLMRTRSGAEMADSAMRRTRLASDGASYLELFGDMEDGATRNTVSIEDMFKAIKDSTYLSEDAYKSVDEGATKIGGVMRQIALQTEDFIGKRVTGMINKLKAGIIGAKNLIDADKPLLGMMTYAVFLKFYKLMEAVEAAGEIGAGGWGEMYKQTTGLGGIDPAGAGNNQRPPSTDLGGRTGGQPDPQAPSVNATESERMELFGANRPGGSTLVTAPIQIYLGNELLNESQATVVANWIESLMPNN